MTQISPENKTVAIIKGVDSEPQMSEVILARLQEAMPSVVFAIVESGAVRETNPDLVIIPDERIVTWRDPTDRSGIDLARRLGLPTILMNSLGMIEDLPPEVEAFHTIRGLDDLTQVVAKKLALEIR